MPGPETWVDPETPGPDVVCLGHLTDPVTPDWHTWLFRRDHALVIRTRRDRTGSEGQRTVPLAAAAWIYHAITEGFWRSPEEGGFAPTVTRLETTITGERLELRRSWGLGGPEGLGFTLTNLSRLTAAGYPEEYPMTDELLITGGLLDLLKRIGDLSGSA